MSKDASSFGFTQLEEEDDGDEAQYQTGSLDLQPHLGEEEHQTTEHTSQNNQTSNNFNLFRRSGSNRFTGGFDNPALSTDLESEQPSSTKYTVSFERRGSFSTDPEPGEINGQSPGSTEPKPTSIITESDQRPTEASSGVPVSNGSTATKSNTFVNGRNGAENGVPTTNPSTGTSAPTESVNIYDGSEGQVNVRQGVVVTRPDGSRYIDTRAQNWGQMDDTRYRPLRPERIRFLKIFSIISCIFFFPTGIAAVYYAFRTKTEFDEGILRGNIDRAQKFSKRAERFIILTFILAIVFAALIAAIIERPYYSQHHTHSGPYAG